MSFVVHCPRPHLSKHGLLVVFAMIASVSLLSPAAYAGSYVWSSQDPNTGVTTYSPAYDGGTTTEVSVTTNTNRTDHYAFDTRPTPPTYGVIGGTLAYPDAQGNSTSASATGGGSLSAKFTWRPDYAGEPVPAGVIIQRDCSVRTGFTFPSGGTLTYQSNTGLGQNNSGPSANTFSGSVTIAGTSYTGAVPVADGSVSAPACSPTATINETSGAMSTGGGLTQATFTTTYTATAYIPTIRLTGTTPDSSGNQNILVGQGCTASVSGIPYEIMTNAAHPPVYKWSVSGTTFQNWSPTTPANPNASPPSAANANASYYVPGPGPVTNSTAHWYWNDPANKSETITCSVTLTPPTGQGAAFTITVTKNVSVQIPVVKQKTNTIGAGYIGQYTSSPTDVAMYAGPTPQMVANHQDDGSTWTSAVSLPPSPTYSGIGKFGYVQLITPGEYLTGNDNIQVKSTDTGVEALDAVFPYDSSTHPIDGNPYNNGDSPALDPLDDTNYAAAKLTDTFKVYLMFQPPANPAAPNDVQWIPLAESEWSTNINKPRPSGGHWSSYSPTVAVGTVVLKNDFTPQNVHPKWIKVLAKNTPFLHQ